MLAMFPASSCSFTEIRDSMMPLKKEKPLSESLVHQTISPRKLRKKPVEKEDTEPPVMRNKRDSGG
jgi:hypothetical protein